VPIPKYFGAYRHGV